MIMREHFPLIANRGMYTQWNTSTFVINDETITTIRSYEQLKHAHSDICYFLIWASARVFPSELRISVFHSLSNVGSSTK